MAKYRIESVKESTDGDVHCETYVLNNANEVIGHFTVVLDSAEILAAGGTVAQRVAVYKALFFADSRIALTVDSESAVAKMNNDVSFPVTSTCKPSPPGERSQYESRESTIFFIFGSIFPFSLRQWSKSHPMMLSSVVNTNPTPIFSFSAHLRAVSKELHVFGSVVEAC